MSKKTKKVLIIDDEKAILDALSTVLESEGYLVKTILCADGAVEKIKKIKPDLVILDVLLSGQDGKQIARKIKSEESLGTIPILMVSAHPNVRSEVLDSGADDFLPKPFDIATFMNKVRGLSKSSRKTHLYNQS